MPGKEVQVTGVVSVDCCRILSTVTLHKSLSVEALQKLRVSEASNCGKWGSKTPWSSGQPGARTLISSADDPDVLELSCRKVLPNLAMLCESVE